VFTGTVTFTVSLTGPDTGQLPCCTHWVTRRRRARQDNELLPIGYQDGRKVYHEAAGSLRIDEQR